MNNDAQTNFFAGLLQKARREPISNEELDTVVTFLSTSSNVDPYLLLHILALQGDDSYASVVVPFLAGPDGLLTAKALSVLCLDWHLTNSYIPTIDTLIRGAPWDTYEDARSMAIACVGDYLRHHSNSMMLRRILEITEDVRTDKRIRLSAYTALVDALGADRTVVPINYEDFNPEHHIDPSVLHNARVRLLHEDSK